jgi:membrane protein DedA with SNARE-associated domain
MILNASFAGTVQWLLQHGYTVFFIVMIIEGPVISAAGAFIAALGYFNIWIIAILSVLGNLIPDLIYYAIGYWGREKLVTKYGHYIGITKPRLAAAEKLIERHAGKSLIAIKLVPLLATPGLIAAGITRMDFKKFAWWCVIITIPSSALYLVLGYYFGAAYGTIDHYLHIGGYIIAAAAVIVILVIYLQRKYSWRFIKLD